jgi:small subunit ribosomal protein S14
MQALIKKNKLVREKYRNLELNFYINSALKKNKLLSPSIQGVITNLNTALTISPEISKVRNMCVVTGRTRAVIQKYKLSRIKFKQNAEAGNIPGIKKL